MHIKLPKYTRPHLLRMTNSKIANVCMDGCAALNDPVWACNVGPYVHGVGVGCTNGEIAAEWDGGASCEDGNYAKIDLFKGESCKNGTTPNTNFNACIVGENGTI